MLSKSLSKKITDSKLNVPQRRSSTAGGSNKSDNKLGKLQVLCRFRPRQNIRLPENYSVDAEARTVDFCVDEWERRSFTFDSSLNSRSTQEQVFNKIENIVESIISGYNGTVLAYGQTSSGKTHTMEGPNLRDPVLKGVIPRTVDKLFQLISQADPTVEFYVTASYFEIYCEKLRDLLNPAQDNMKLREVKNEGFMVQGITEESCTTREQVLRVVEVGKRNRATSPTLMNAESSRSHSILQLCVAQKKSNGQRVTSRLYLVDLAGSEKVGKTGATGERLKEAQNINKSLAALGMVINALSDKSTHVPYRDSKLTRILMDSIGGNSRTLLIICCSPEPAQTAESLSTLRFGERAKLIQNDAKANTTQLGVSELQALLTTAMEEVKTLRLQMSSSNSQAEDGAAGSKAIIDDDRNRVHKVSSGSTLSDMDGIANDIELYMEGHEEMGALRQRIFELENEKAKWELTDRQLSSLAGEVQVQSIVVKELESRLLQNNMEAGAATGDINKETILSAGTNEEAGEEDHLTVSSLENDTSQLNDILESELKNLEDFAAGRAEREFTNALSKDLIMKLAIAYTERFSTLKTEYDAISKRMMVKLFAEQEARVELENRLYDEQLMVRKLEEQIEVVENRKSKSSGGATSSFTSLFGMTTPTVVESAFAEVNYPPAAPLTIARGTARDKVAKLESESADLYRVKLTQAEAAIVSEKEKHKLEIELKDFVLKSILDQYNAVVLERDELLFKSEERNSTMKQLVALMQTFSVPNSCDA